MITGVLVKDPDNLDGERYIYIVAEKMIDKKYYKERSLCHPFEKIKALEFELRKLKEGFVVTRYDNFRFPKREKKED